MYLFIYLSIVVGVQHGRSSADSPRHHALQRGQRKTSSQGHRPVIKKISRIMRKFLVRFFSLSGFMLVSLHMRLVPYHAVVSFKSYKWNSRYFFHRYSSYVDISIYALESLWFMIYDLWFTCDLQLVIFACFQMC